MPDPIILAVDTTSEFGSVAVRRGNDTLADLHLHTTDGFGQHIIQQIAEALKQAQVKLSEVDCFAAASGPGSFTGVRVGLAAIKGLAEAMHKPAAAISNLRALSLVGHNALRAVVLDARRGQVYAAVYDAEARLVVPEIVCSWEEWLKHLPAEAELIGRDDGPLKATGVPFTVGSQWLAVAVAQCAQLNGPAGWTDPIAVDANYVRKSDAEMFWKEN